jgi:hypothetical protein
MNERIEKLAEQSGFTVARGWGLKDTVPKDVFIANVRVSDEMKKFAELIVRECADNIAGNIDLINPESSYNYGLRRAMNSVKEHFGVEE